MHYLGGKARLAAHFAHLIQEALDAPDASGLFYEPFTGGFNIVPHLRFLSGECADLHPGLVTLYRAVQGGWRPPFTTTREEYDRRKAAPDWTDPVTTFYAFGVAFSGKEWGSYVESTPENDYARRASEALLAKARSMRGVNFVQRDYRETPVKRGDVVYCDPPYLGTTGYGKIEFDHEPFYDQCDAWAAAGAKVFVSEFTLPSRPGWEQIWSVERQVQVNNGSKAEGRERKTNIRTDRLAEVKPWNTAVRKA